MIMNTQNTTENLELMTVKEVAELLRLKPQTIRLYLINGRLPREIVCSKWHKKPMFLKDKLIDFVRNPEKYQERLCI